MAGRKASWTCNWNGVLEDELHFSRRRTSYSGRRTCLEQRHGREKRDRDEGITSDPSGIQAGE